MLAGDRNSVQTFLSSEWDYLQGYHSSSQTYGRAVALGIREITSRDIPLSGFFFPDFLRVLASFSQAYLVIGMWWLALATYQERESSSF